MSSYRQKGFTHEKIIADHRPPADGCISGSGQRTKHGPARRQLQRRIQLHREDGPGGTERQAGIRETEKEGQNRSRKRKDKEALFRAGNAVRSDGGYLGVSQGLETQRDEAATKNKNLCTTEARRHREQQKINGSFRPAGSLPF